MKQTSESRISDADSLLELLLLLKEKTLMDTHVATLAYVDEVQVEKTDDNKFGLVKCKPFPLDEDREEYTVFAYYFNKDSEFNKNDIVLILYTDLNFISGLDSVDNKPKPVRDIIYHSTKCGIIINTK
jgi:hypothetical protein